MTDATPEVPNSNGSKPCSACRRRKVRCDKSRPHCQNCQRHGEVCVYDRPAETDSVFIESQKKLQERIEKLEQLVQDLSIVNTSASHGSSVRNSPRHPSPEGIFPDRFRGSSSVHPEDHGIQVFEPGSCYYMHPDYWVDLNDIHDEPRELLRTPAGDETIWPRIPTAPSVSNSTLDSLAPLHLPIEQEDLLIDWYNKHVEPFMKCSHRQAGKNEISLFRIGRNIMPGEIEAGIFAVQALTVAAMPSSSVQLLLGQDRREMIRHFRDATERAFVKANLMRTRNHYLFSALLQYITFMFQIGDSEKASSLLGIASRIGMRMGLHRDNTLYSFSPFAGEMRTRLWTYFLVLDQPNYNAEGAESLFDTIPWNKRSLNVNDHDWPSHRFVKADQVPPDADGFTDMTFALVRRELFHLSRELRRIVKSTDRHGRSALIDEFETRIRQKYIDYLDKHHPMQCVIIQYTECYLDEVRLQSEFSRKYGAPPHDAETCTKALTGTIEMFEKLEQLDALLTQNHWQWMLRWPLPLHAIGRLLTKLAELPAYADAERAWRQVDVIFRRHNNDDFSMVNVPAWRVVERLCDQAMLAHSSRVHTGCSYATRLLTNMTPPAEAHISPLSNIAETSYADIDMFQQFSNEGSDFPPWITPSTSNNQAFSNKPEDMQNFPPNSNNVFGR